MPKLESKFWQDVKKNLKDISFTRLENTAALGTPDVLCYNKNKTFFTIELKVTRGNSVRFSPHQISFHIRHPHKTFILIFPVIDKHPKLYPGSLVHELFTNGHRSIKPIADSWSMIQEHLSNLN